MKLSIVTTLYHSSKYVIEFYRRVVAAAEKITPDLELIFVNDGSPDNSLELVIRLAGEDPRVQVIDLSRNFGHHRAIMTGLVHATGNLIFQIDSDLEEEPEILQELYAQLIQNRADVAYGVQGKRKGGFLERSLGDLFYKLFDFLSDIKYPYNALMARLMTRRYVDALLLHKEKELDLGGLWAATGFSQVPVVVHKGHKGSTTYTFTKRLGLAIRSITAFSNKPLLIIAGVGAVVLMLAFFYFLYILWVYIFVGTPPDGFITLILSLWFLGGVIIFSIGILAIYISVIFSEIKNRPYTIVRQIYKTENK